MLKEYRFGEIYVRHAVDEEPQNTPFTMHIHEQGEIYLFISGNIEYLVEGSKYSLEENSIMLMRPAEAHTPNILEGEKYERYAINFPLNMVEGVDAESRLLKAFLDRPLGKNNMIPAAAINTSLIRQLCDQMFQEYSDEYDRLLTIKTNIMLILNMIYHAHSSQEKGDEKPRSLSERMVAYVNNHIFEQISVPDIAGHFYLSTSQLNRLFRQATGASPWEYITKKRLTTAKEKIHSGSTAQSAAEYCGFKDYSSFYRAYTKYYGCSPTSEI